MTINEITPQIKFTNPNHKNNSLISILFLYPFEKNPAAVEGLRIKEVRRTTPTREIR
jgi:hypothetical protein